MNLQFKFFPNYFALKNSCCRKSWRTSEEWQNLILDHKIIRVAQFTLYEKDMKFLKIVKSENVE